MMRAALLCVGKLKERYWREACAEYQKRLTRYAALEVIEVPDAPEPVHESPGAEAQVLRTEGERILAKIRPDDVVVALAVEGKALDSVAFAKRVDALSQRGRVIFVIGGSLGLSPEVYARANERLSFSTLTFPHQMMRVVFLEQLYRACRILSGERYHK
ncbi:MAG: 23S rRNA (pseudouridine(1915)-N(3))-methyltransferase RlmH [Candidatus Spyradocola sp.]|jgi:23S rRNA (pseudouridine1915-N3)-methyltransferase